MSAKTSHLHPATTESDSARPGAAAVISLAELPDHAGDGKPAIQPDANPLHGVKVQVQVRIGTIETTLGALLTAKTGEVLSLDRTLQQPVDLQIDGRTVARGQLVALDGCFAVRVTELPSPLRP